MFNPVKSSLLAAATFAAISLVSTGGAFAACAYSEWVSTLPNHPVPHMTGRDCNGVLALNAFGEDAQGNVTDFGWTPMLLTSPDNFSATFVGADATNDVRLTVHAIDQTMNVAITTTLNDGTVTNWGGHYKLESIH